MELLHFWSCLIIKEWAPMTGLSSDECRTQLYFTERAVALSVPDLLQPLHRSALHRSHSARHRFTPGRTPPTPEPEQPEQDRASDRGGCDTKLWEEHRRLLPLTSSSLPEPC